MLMRLLRSHLGKFRWLLVGVVILQAMQSLATLYLPRLNADIIDKGIATGDSGYIWRTGGLMLVITLGQVVLAVGAVYLGARTAMGFGRDVRRSLFHTVTGFSAHEVGELGAPSLITRVTNDVQQVQMVVLMTCTLLIAAPITAVGGVILALREDVGLTMILLVSVPVLLLGVSLVLVRMVPQFRAMQERIDVVNGVLREQLIGLRVIRAFVREPYESHRFDAANSDLTDTSLRAGRLMAMMMPIVIIVLNVSSIAAIWIGASRIADGHLQIGALIAFLSYLVQILTAVMMATFMAVMVPRASVSAERIQEVLDTPLSIVVAEHPVVDLRERGSLRLEDVGFRYPGAEDPVLEGISLRIDAGQTLAVVGSTGSGKSTLINLIPRLYDATSGHVIVDGADVRDVDPEVLWGRIGLVPQRPYLFSGTVASNLRFGNDDASDDELWEALAVAQAADFVAEMEGGLDARITQGGSNVSGGQRQRLAIARALVHTPDVFLFDDSFSALDLATDARLRAALVPRIAHAATVIVAQRVTSIVNAHQILVLEDGRQVGLGTHAELFDTCATYAEIVNSQSVGASA